MNDFKSFLAAKNLSEKTLKVYASYVHNFLDWCEQGMLDIAEIGYTEIMDYVELLQQNGATAKYVNINLKAIEYYYQSLQQEYKQLIYPAKGLTIKGTRKTVVLTIEHEKIIEAYSTLASIKQRDRLRKCMMSLILFQALRAHELQFLKPKDINLSKGTIFIAGTRKTVERELKLDPSQILLIHEYMAAAVDQGADAYLFQYAGRRDNIHNILHQLLKRIRKEYPIKNWQLVRNTVIVEWLKEYNLRQVQYWCGHRYVSSTEHYKKSITDKLEKDLEQFHPLKSLN